MSRTFLRGSELMLVEQAETPPLARNLVDPEGVALIEAWISSMPTP